MSAAYIWAFAAALNVFFTVYEVQQPKHADWGIAAQGALAVFCFGMLIITVARERL